MNKNKDKKTIEDQKKQISELQREILFEKNKANFCPPESIKLVQDRRQQLKDVSLSKNILQETKNTEKNEHKKNVSGMQLNIERLTSY